MQTKSFSKNDRPTPKEFRNSVQSNLGRVIGIDPGFDRVGVAIMDMVNGKEKIIFSECITTNKKESHSNRLFQIGKRIGELVTLYSPKTLAIEKLFFNANITTALQVSEARGVIIYECTKQGLELREYSPQEIKIAVTGYGKAAKNEVQTMVARLLALKTLPKLDDEIDALAVGITFFASERLASKLSPSK